MNRDFLLPYYSGAVAELLLPGASAAAASESPKVAHVSFAVEGMDCPACASAVEIKLKAVKGVRSVGDSSDSKKADVDFDPLSTTVSELQKAIEDAGYDAREANRQRSSTKTLRRDKLRGKRRSRRRAFSFPAPHRIVRTEALASARPVDLGRSRSRVLRE